MYELYDHSLITKQDNGFFTVGDPRTEGITLLLSLFIT